LLSKKAESNPKVKRLKKNADFLKLRKKGLKIRACDWLQVQFIESSDSYLAVGVTTGRKVGSAVIRNRLKRWCLEFFKRRAQQEMISGHINVLFRPQKQGFYKELSHEELDEELQKAFRRIF
jgi:ribonuclease P protein component